MKKRPYVFLKWAQTADGFIDADRSPEQTPEIRWISQPETQVVTHKMRTTEQAILVGWRTVLTDNPSLTPRAFVGPNPLRIVLDSTLQAPKTATIFTDGLPTVVLNTIKNEQFGQVEFLKLEKLTVDSILSSLYERSILSLIIEGGATVLNQFIQSNLWDEALIITGENKFESGLKAPILTISPSSSTKFGKDSLTYYLNK